MRKGSIFKASRVILVLVVALGIALLLIKMKPKAQRQVRTETGRLVEVLSPKAENIHMVIEAFGTTKPREVLKLVAEVAGHIVGIDPSWQEGGFIRKQTEMIKIDPRTYQLEVERQRVQITQAEAELNRLQQEARNLKASIKIAKSDASLANNEVVRLKELSTRKVVAQTTLDKAEQRYLVSLDRLQALQNQLALIGPMRKQIEAQRNMTKVMLRQAELNLEKTTIVAPFDGWVLEKAIEEGQHVTAGQYLGRIHSAGALDIEVRIPVKDLKWFPARLTQENPVEADVVFDNDGILRVWKGHVTRTKAQMDEQTRTLPVVVEVNETLPMEGNPKPDYLMWSRLRPGMFVKVQMKGRKVNQAFVLPRHVVHTGDVVYTVINNRLKIRPVSVLRRFKESVIVDKGLSESDLVVKTPLSGAVDGMLLRVTNPPRDGALKNTPRGVR